MIHTNRELAQMYRGYYYNYRGDGVARTAKAIARAPVPIAEHYAKHGNLDRLYIRGMPRTVLDNIERLLT